MGAVTEEAAQMGEFVALRRVAIGGMAEIFLARKRGLSGFERLVVLKRILPEYAHNQDFIRMFLNEARIAATLHHQNIVQVHAMGEERGQVYFAMEFLHGEDLSRVLSRAGKLGVALPLDAVMAIMSAVCAGLHYAHERCGTDGKPLGIVHRDVSPHNVFVTYEGGVKLLDFGIAKATTTIGKTRTGVLKGKVAYMSPEQAYSQPVDRRSDIFCLGILLWELSTGRRLYRRRSELETLKALVDADAPPPSSVISGYPPELEHIVMKCLAREPQDRWSTCEELSMALEAFGRDQDLQVSSQLVTRMMRGLFAPEIGAFEEAVRAGGDLVDQVVLRMEATERKSSIDDWDSDVASVIIDLGSDSGVKPRSQSAFDVPSVVIEASAPARSPTPIPTRAPTPPPSAAPTYPPPTSFAPRTTPFPPSPTPFPPTTSAGEVFVPRSPLKSPWMWLGAGSVVALGLVVMVVIGRNPHPAISPESPASATTTPMTVEPTPTPTPNPTPTPTPNPTPPPPPATALDTTDQPPPTEASARPPTIPAPRPPTVATTPQVKVATPREAKRPEPKKPSRQVPTKKPSAADLDGLPASKKKPSAKELDTLPM